MDYSYTNAYEDGTKCSEVLAQNFHTPRNHPPPTYPKKETFTKGRKFKIRNELFIKFGIVSFGSIKALYYTKHALMYNT